MNGSESFAKRLLASQWRVAALLMALSLLAAAGVYDPVRGVARLRVDPSLNEMLPAEDPARRFYEELLERFGSDDVVLVALVSDTLFTPEGLATVARTHRALARIDGVADRDAAEALKGTELFIDREALPQPDEEEFYHTDLIGLPALLADGSAYGTVRALHEFGAGDMIEIALEGGGVSVLPFTRAVVPEIDLETGRITVEPPAETIAKSEDGA